MGAARYSHRDLGHRMAQPNRRKTYLINPRETKPA